MKNVKCLKCIKCGKEYEALPDATTCECGGILDVIYDYDYIRENFTPDDISSSKNYTMWRYRPFLPVEEDTVQPPLRVGWSPLYEEPRMAEKLGIRKFWLKDDGLNPTASLKDRASSMGVAKARPETRRARWQAMRQRQDSRLTSSFLRELRSAR